MPKGRNVLLKCYSKEKEKKNMKNIKNMKKSNLVNFEPIR